MSEKPNIDQLADTVRGPFLVKHDYQGTKHLGSCRRCRLDAALDELVALARSGDAKQHPFSTGLAWAERAEAAEARVAELEEELERAEIDGAWRRDTAAMRDRALSAGRRIAALEAALREIRMQATRHKRAIDEQQYLVTDLEIIEAWCDKAVPLAGDGGDRDSTSKENA